MRRVFALGSLLVLGCHSEETPLPSYDASVPTGTGNWQPAPEGTAAVQTAEVSLLPNIAGVTWETDYATALSRAATEGKNVFVLMTRSNCPNTTLLADQVLASTDMLTLLSEKVVPLVLSIDTINTLDLAARAGKPTLSGDALADNDERLTLKNAIYDKSNRDPRQPPFLGLVDKNGSLLAADTGLLAGKDVLALLSSGGVPDLPASLSAPDFAPTRTPPARIASAFQEVMTGNWPTGNGAAGEAPNGVELSSVPDPFPIAGTTHGLAAYSIAFAGTGRTTVGQIVVSAGGTGNETMNFTNPPLLVDWSNSGEGIQYYNPTVGPDVESTVYANGANFITVMSSTSTGTISIVGCPPAHRWYNGTVRVGRHPMGVALGYAKTTPYAFVASPVDGTLAAVYLDMVNGEKMGDRTGETWYFDAATGEKLAHRAAAEQLIDSEGRGGGQTGFGTIPGSAGPTSVRGALLGAEDVMLYQGNNYANDGIAFLLVTNVTSNTVSVFDVAPFFQGRIDHLLLVGTYTGITNPRKIHWIGNQYAWVTSNPGNTVSRLRLDTLPTIDDSLTETYAVGKNPMHVHDLAAWWNQSLVFVTNSGDNSVSVLREDGTAVGTLDASNGPALSEPYGIWGSIDGLRVVVSNRKGDYATYWNIRRGYEGDSRSTLTDVIVSSGQIRTGSGVTGFTGYYIP